MVLPSSGSIAVSQIEAEYGVPASTAQRISNDLGPMIYKTPGSTVSMSDFRGKAASFTVNGYAWQGGSVGTTTGLTGSEVYFYNYGSVNSTVRVIINGTNPSSYYSFYLNNGTYRTPRFFVHMTTGFTGTVAVQSQPGNTTAGTWITRTTLAVSTSNVSPYFYIAAEV